MAEDSDVGKIVVTETKPGKALEATLSVEQSFCSFIDGSSRACVVGFFRELARELEHERSLVDFHMKLVEYDGKKARSFKVQVFYGDEEREGPVDVPPGECISCFAHAVLYPGKKPKVTAGECVMDEIGGDGHVQCSIDAKARPGFIITPLRHVERMTDLDDGELFSLWNTAAKALRSENLPSFRCMILNHGQYRNLPHLHLKVWVDDGIHRAARNTWPLQRRELWRWLQELSSMDVRKCKFFLSKQGCRRGSRCTFLHR
ncbi:hypothetical protein KP509_02G057200 [Ceratopteris richardii]|uniref:C3H1-type domain-containing protein n=1 Tax=Ceratopteris richardii TaxID=49495 RepID=A0A8T2V994_CERRI|nr:hypothetical protein KP509_02G057200 [Ceratopteris richardii]